MNPADFLGIVAVNFRLCIIEITSSISRTVITTLGLFLGVVSLLVNLAFVRGMDDDLRANMEQIGGLNILTVRQVEAETPREQKRFQRSPGLGFDELDSICADLPYVATVIRSHELGYEHLSGSGNRSYGYVIACDSSFFPTFNYTVAQGRLFTENDLRNRSPVCVIGSRVAERLFPGTNPIGRRITLHRTYSLTVVGLFESKSVRSRRDIECCIPFPLYASRFRNSERNLESVSIVLTSSDAAEQARGTLSQRIKAAHRGVEDFTVELSADKIREMRNASMAMKIVLLSIAFISLLVGGISIMNIMFATIGDRIREIGIRKALGARRYDLFIQFLLEALLVCCFGGLPGMVLGALIVFIPEGVFPYDPRLTSADFTVAFGFLIISGILSGLFPALRAASMQPVEALRY
jgi:ABC-type lipoprotein release transport system permease subunit